MLFACKYHTPFLWGNGKEFILHEYLPSCFKYRAFFQLCWISRMWPIHTLPSLLLLSNKTINWLRTCWNSTSLLPLLLTLLKEEKRRIRFWLWNVELSAFLISWSALVYSDKRCGYYLRNISRSRYCNISLVLFYKDL